MITPLHPARLYCVNDPTHAKFYYEQPASKLYILNQDRAVVDESCFDRSGGAGDVHCYLCNGKVVDFQGGPGLKDNLAEALRILMARDSVYARDETVRQAVSRFMRDVVDARLFLRPEIKNAVPMKALLTKYGLQRSVVEYYKEKFGPIPVPASIRARAAAAPSSATGPDEDLAAAG